MRELPSGWMPDDPPELLDRNTDNGWKAKPYSDAVEILVPADGANVYLFGGPTMLKAVQRYNLYNGGGVTCLPNGDWDLPRGCPHYTVIKIF